MSVYDLLSMIGSPDESTWTPKEPPCLDGVQEIVLDCETSGLRWWAGDRPVGFAIALPDGSTQYLPFGHRSGNLDEATVKRWAHQELRNKHIVNLNTKFDVHHLREWGIDLEAQGCTVSDVSHYAALLDDHRGNVDSNGVYHGFSQESLVRDYLEDEEKVRLVDNRELDMKRAGEYHAGTIAVRAEADVRQVWKLKRKFWPMLDAQDLQRVRQLEDDLIFVTCEMERNGTLIDIELLDKWMVDTQNELARLARDIAHDAGFMVNPRAPSSMIRLFEKLRLPIAHTQKGAASFTADILKKIPHPTVQKCLRWIRISNLRSKSLVPYATSVDRRTGIMRYSLHQLRAQADPYDEFDDSGTVSGRYSSTKAIKNNELLDDEGLNIQQVIKPEKQRVAMGYDEDDDSHDDEIYVIRKLHIAPKGQHFLSSDAMQIEYRLFADYTRSPRLLNIYKENPLASFHKKTHVMFLEYKPDLTYRRMKDTNFANIYGAGIRKKALMLEYISSQEYRELMHRSDWKTHPALKEVFELNGIYDRMIPEAKELMDKAKHLAMPECDDYCNKSFASRRLHQQYKHQGYVKSLLKRRSRFPGGKRAHKALNCVIQPGAADILKTKLVELHKARRDTGFTLCFTVHDEADGYAPTLESAQRVATILNQQSFSELIVPILWETSIGPNWKDGVNV